MTHKLLNYARAPDYRLHAREATLTVLEPSARHHSAGAFRPAAAAAAGRLILSSFILLASAQKQSIQRRDVHRAAVMALRKSRIDLTQGEAISAL